MDQMDMINKMMHMAGAGYWMYFPDRNCIECSPGLLALLGISGAEAPITVEDCAKWVHHDDWSHFQSHLLLVTARDGEVCQLSYRLLCGDAGERWVVQRSFVLTRADSGKPQSIGGFLFDSTSFDGELREAKNIVNNQYGLLQAVNNVAALLLGDHENDFHRVLVDALGALGRSVHVHRAYVWKNSVVDGRLYCQRLAEWEVDATIRQEGESGLVPYDEFFPDLDKQLASQDELLLHVSEMGDALAAFPGIEGVVTLLAMPVILYGQFWGFIGFDDMAEKRSFTPAQLNILKSGGMLIASGIMRNEMIDSLIEAREAALASMNAKSEFLSRMSHEIRTPMNAIIGMNEIAKSSNNPERVKYCLRKIEKASHQLLSLINDILDLSKIESGKMEINCAKFNFEKMLENVYNVVQPRVEEKGLHFSFDIRAHYGCCMISDELRLTQVMTNLLSNAAKFTPQGGSITLRTCLTEQADGDPLLRVEVQDTGIGISPEDQSKLFQPFEQADGSITRRFGGSGLGLSICRNIIDLMAGKIWVESKPGEGSRFIFEVPIQLGGPSIAPPHSLHVPQNTRILVVDDSADVLEYCQQMITRFGIHCDIASSGEEALAMLMGGQPHYHIIFIDWKMPGMDGIQTAEAIGKLVSADTIVIMISVADWNDMKEAAAKVGITRYLAKPLLPSSLYNTIVKLVGDGEAQEEKRDDETSFMWPGKTVLMAEDIEINREIIRTLLEPTQLTIVCANNGAEAVALYCAEPSRFDLVLMDVQMPEMDGYEATRRLRTSGHVNSASIPILAMTADAFTEDVQRCLAAGMNDHISKPINVDELMSKLNCALQ